MISFQDHDNSLMILWGIPRPPILGSPGYNIARYDFKLKFVCYGGQFCPHFVLKSLRYQKAVGAGIVRFFLYNLYIVFRYLASDNTFFTDKTTPTYLWNSKQRTESDDHRRPEVLFLIFSVFARFLRSSQHKTIVGTADVYYDKTAPISCPATWNKTKPKTYVY